MLKENINFHQIFFLPNIYPSFLFLHDSTWQGFLFWTSSTMFHNLFATFICTLVLNLESCIMNQINFVITSRKSIPKYTLLVMIHKNWLFHRFIHKKIKLQYMNVLEIFMLQSMNLSMNMDQSHYTQQELALLKSCQAI